MIDVALPSPDTLDQCLTWPATIVETPLGPVEYAERGEGFPVLCVHGGPGGVDQALLFGELFRVNGFRIIASSRPGYLGTPLSSGPSPAAQADLLHALLRALDIPRAAVIGISAGGPSTYLLAARHPDAIAGLIAVDAVCRDYRVSATPLEQKIFLTPAGLRLTLFFAEHFPKSTMENLLATEGNLDRQAVKARAAAVLADPLKHALFVAMVRTFAERFAQRQTGVNNDLATLAKLGDLPLSDIVCPALILHGDADADVPMDHARYAATHIPGASLEIIPDGTHFGFYLADDAATRQASAVRWLRRVVAPARG